MATRSEIMPGLWEALPGQDFLVRKEGTLLALVSPLFHPLQKGGAWKALPPQRGILNVV